MTPCVPIGSKGNLCQRKLPLGISMALTLPCATMATYYLLLQTYALRLEAILNSILLVFCGAELLLAVLTLAAFCRSGPSPGGHGACSASGSGHRHCGLPLLSGSQAAAHPRALTAFPSFCQCGQDLKQGQPPGRPQQGQRRVLLAWARWQLLTPVFQLSSATPAPCWATQDLGTFLTEHRDFPAQGYFCPVTLFYKRVFSLTGSQPLVLACVESSPLGGPRPA